MSVLAQPRYRVLAAALLFAAALAGTLGRVVAHPATTNTRVHADWVMVDFEANQYYPVQALLDGENPYDIVGRYPVTQGNMPYAPANFLLHLPFGLLPLRVADLTYFILTALLTVPLAHATLRLAGVASRLDRVLFLAGAILLSRPGHWTVLLGQTTILLTLAAYVVLLDQSRAQLKAAAGLFVALIKATYGLPLLLFAWMLRKRRAVLLGLAVAAAVNLPVLAMLAARTGGVAPFIRFLVTSLAGNQESAVTSPIRIDLTSLAIRLSGGTLSPAGQLVVTCLLLALSAAVVRLLAGHATRTAHDLAVGIICLTMALAGYHIGYDALLVIAPMLRVLAKGVPHLPGTGWRITLLALYALPLCNWLATYGAMATLQPSRPIWLAIASSSAICLTMALSAYLYLGVRYHLGASAAAAAGSDPLIGADGMSPTPPAGYR